MMVQNRFQKAIERTFDRDTVENRLSDLTYVFEDETVLVYVPAEYIKQWLLDNRFEEKFKRILIQLTQKEYQIQFLLKNFKKDDSSKIEKSFENFDNLKESYQDNPYNEKKGGKYKKKFSDYGFNSHELNPEYHFGSFIVGESNELAYHASKSVAFEPGGTNYNPLFVYGGVGLGKTHLLHAIAQEAAIHKPSIRVVNLTTEEFLNEYFESVRNRSSFQLVDRFRKNCDLLLIDDIQFLSGKMKTQEHFFHIFNHLKDSQKQIVITSDRYPQEIPDIEDRLRSRFEWGLIVEILPPNYETRIKIIEKKSLQYSIFLDEESIEILAKNLRSNIREIESSLKTLKAIFDIKRVPITAEGVKDYLRNSGKLSEKILSIEQIKKYVSKFYDLSIDDLISNKRQKIITVPRQIAMYLSKNLTEETLNDIGKAFGRDHSTVVNSIKKIDQLMGKDIKIQKDISILKKMLTN